MRAGGVGCVDGGKMIMRTVARHSQSTVMSAMPRRVWRRCSRSLEHPRRHRSSGAAWAHLAAADALFLQVFAALNNSPGARTFYDRQRARDATHYQALRTLANRLAGILHGCLRHQTLSDENHAWHTDEKTPTAAACKLPATRPLP